VEAGKNCPFQVIDPVDGDVTADPLTEYVIAPGAAVTVDTVHKWFTFDTYALGAVIIYAIYDNQSTHEVVFRVPPPFTWNNTEADTGDPALDAVGKYCSMTDINGMPSIASYDVTAGILRYAYYTTTPAPGWHASTVDASAVVGRSCTLMELHDRPVICYRDSDNHTLKFALGETDQPSGPADWIVYAVRPDVFPCATSMCIINDRPVIVFHDEDYFNLIYMTTNETYPDDISDWESHQITAAGDEAKPSVQAVNGLVGLAYYDNDATDLHYCRSKTASPHGAGDWVIMDVDTGGNVGYDPCLYAIDGWQPAIAYYDWTNSDLKYAQAKTANPLSAADWDISYIVKNTDDIGKVISMDEVQGTLCLAYANTTDGSIWFSRNKHADPLGPQDWQSWEVIPGPDLGEHISIANLFDPLTGVPGIAYYDYSSGNLRAAWTTDF
jgi:hypothetical protein